MKNWEKFHKNTFTCDTLFEALDVPKAQGGGLEDFRLSLLVVYRSDAEGDVLEDE